MYVSALERAALAALAQAGLTEVTRERVTNYTYWDYQRLRFPRNEGMRIDFILQSFGAPRAVRPRLVGLPQAPRHHEEVRELPRAVPP